jgi:hypothetical protein
MCLRIKYPTKGWERLGKKGKKDKTEYLTVQGLSASVEGKAQKYTRIGPLHDNGTVST